MKKILIVISDMGLGGAQRSLAAFLQCLMGSAQSDAYEIHLMVVKPTGAFLEHIPERVKRVEPPKELYWLGSHLSAALLKEHFSWRSILGESWWLLRKHLRLFDKRLNVQQKMWQSWQTLIPNRQDHYDVAISYIDGFPNYYVMDKVRADRKILWIHNEYRKLGYEPEFDRRFYDACQGIITISQRCKECIVSEFPHLEEKVHILENITSSETLLAQSDAGTGGEFEDFDGLKLLSVGRLSAQKGYHLSVGAAKRLKDAGIKFLWLILGEGPEHRALQEQIDSLGVSDCIRLMGAVPNPYPFMKQCDMLVQSSLFEGKSVVLDEAKILCKPIVATNYTTVGDSICHGQTGWIVDMTEEAVYEGIVHLWEHEPLRRQITEYLQQLPKGNEAELRKYIEIMLEQ